MEKQVIEVDEIGGTYTGTTAHGTTARGFVFVTGQIATKPELKKPRELEDSEAAHDWGTIEEQTIQAMENVKAILEKAGSSLEHVVKRNVYLAHASDFEESYEVMERYFPSKVASTGVIAGLVLPGSRIEIDVIAVVPNP